MLSDDACIEFVSKKYFVSQDWLFFYKLAGERLELRGQINVSSRGGVGIFGFADLANFGVLHGLRVFSNFGFGFRFSSTMMALFRFVLSCAFYGFTGFVKDVTPRSRAQTGQ